jgi:universal stress protein E
MAGMPLAADDIASDLLEAERARVDEGIQAIAKARGLDPKSVKVLQGAAAEILPRYAEQAKADIIVMGAISRSRLREVFVGSTAERVLDRIHCDVLVVKPADFRERLPF